ncbi:sensor histidine kinase [Natranaerobius thermophilus]|uniref:histidine kinase n=1 Tax=Natranaerobius thermophilus (strain ATCC BAA-1301 / DSM 18059 / JW/NM-WN-LF) TaxID=457570 RepID=B2A1Z9_NATTJ|nr:HAMP domain-containing sensor histidine kinase [Natranaerobius thermophilus]ACB84804.1 integral membrane sensor signal transduction histidine kinase [Natranaerobius thermophilus JW/NM-WN-LF]
MIKKFKPKTLFLKLMLSYLVVILVTLLVLSGIMSYLVEEYFYGAREWEVNTQAREVASMLQEPIQNSELQDIMQKAQTLSRSFEAEIAVFDENGRNITIANYYSDEDTGTVEFENHELDHVLEGNSLTKKLVGPQAERLLIAIPVYEKEEENDEKQNTDETRESDNESESNQQEDDQNEEEQKEVIGVVSLNVPLAGIEDTLANISRLTLISGGIAILVASAFALSLSKNITRPLSSINESAQALAKGEFTQKIGREVLEETDDELGKVSRTFHLAAQEIENNIEEQKRLAVFRKNLVDNASHEFRAPLSAIRGYSELIIDGIVPEQDQTHYLNLIWKHAVELNEMVDTLLDLSSLETGTINLNKEKMTAKEVLIDAMDMVLPDAEKKNQTITIDKSESKTFFKGDPPRVKQIIVNLLKNAIQYTSEKGTIRLRAFDTEQYVALQVVDNGIGIPKSELDSIFQRFYKVDKARNQNKKSGSSGLGLAIVNELVKIHNGKIEVDSEEGKGSTFTVYFPRSYNVDGTE